MISKETSAYLAGCLDCDGTITFVPELYKDIVHVCFSVDLVFTDDADFARSVYEMAKPIGRVRLVRTQKESGLYWRVSLRNQRDIERLLEMLLPYMHKKKNRAEIVLFILKNKPLEKRVLLRKLRELARLNARKGSKRRQWVKDWLNEVVDYRCPWYASDAGVSDTR